MKSLNIMNMENHILIKECRKFILIFTHTGHLVFMAIDNEEIGIDAKTLKV